MENNLMIFSYNDTQVRTAQIGGEPWFVLKDVCTILEMDTTQLKKVADRLDADEKGRTQITTPGGNQETWVINESGLYNVILRSDKPEAKPFRKWVTSEVLPSIRKTGTYSNPQFSSLSPQTQALINMELRQNRLEADQQQTRKLIRDTLTNFGAAPTDEERWRAEINRRIGAMCEEYSLNYQTTIGDMYAELERRAHVNLATRQKNLRERMRLGGAKYAQREAVNKLTIVSQDTKLRYMYEAIVREKEAAIAVSRLPS